MSEEFPWYSVVDGESLEQGDIFTALPVFVPDVSSELITEASVEGATPEVPFDTLSIDAIVVTQSCDLENEKIDTVILCPIWPVSELECQLGMDEGRFENIRKGNEPAWHMINKCDDSGRAISAVEFKRIHTVPKNALQNFASSQDNRIRLRPPYREHLSQSFARYFMRVGLPVPIPRFEKKKKKVATT